MEVKIKVEEMKKEQTWGAEEENKEQHRNIVEKKER